MAKKLKSKILDTTSGGSSNELNIEVGSLFIGGNLDVESYAEGRGGNG